MLSPKDSINFLGYKTWPMSAVNEFRKLTNKVKKELHLIKTPALIIHSKKDKLQHPLNTDLVYNSISSVIKEKLIMENASHNLFIDSADQKKLFIEVSSFLDKYQF